MKERDVSGASAFAFIRFNGTQRKLLTLFVLHDHQSPKTLQIYIPPAKSAHPQRVWFRGIRDGEWELRGKEIKNPLFN